MTVARILLTRRSGRHNIVTPATITPAPVYVGGTSYQSQGIGTAVVSLTALSGGIASAPAAGDFVLVWYGSDTNGTVPGLSVTGYTTEYSATLTDSYSQRADALLAYKRMTATPDTSVTLGGSAGSLVSGCAAVVHVWRGVSAAAPFDVALQSASYTAAGAGSSVNPPAITPGTAGAMIVAFGVGVTAADVGDFSTPADLSRFITTNGGNQYEAVAGAGAIEWPGDAFDPAVWAVASGATQSWIAATVALRPG